VGVRSDGTVIVDDGDKPHPLVPTPAHNGQASVASRWEDVEA
jgi:hypothetical protein